MAAESRIERLLPGLPRVKRHLGLVDPSEESCLAVLARGEQLLVTPGGMREARPARDFYRLRWEGRYGFVRLALATGAPIVPLAVVGGAEAYPGVRARAALALVAAPAPGAARRRARRADRGAARGPEAARDPARREARSTRSRWERTQALYDRVRARRAEAGDLARRERLAPLAGEPARRTARLARAFLARALAPAARRWS